MSLEYQAMCVEYTHGSQNTVDGVKNHQQRYKRNGNQSTIPLGNGHASVITSSELELKAKTGSGSLLSVSVKREFQEGIGRLTEKRRNAISDTMPESITVTKNSDGRVVVDPVIMKDWVEKVKEKL